MSGATIIDLKPPNTQPLSQNQPDKSDIPLSLNTIEALSSDDDRKSLSIPSKPLVSLKRHKSKSFIQKQRLQRVVSKRFTGTKSIIQQALSQYLEDEEFDGKSMKSDLNDPDGYIIDHLAHKFNWDATTRQHFFNEVKEALSEDDVSQPRMSILVDEYNPSSKPYSWSPSSPPIKEEQNDQKSPSDDDEDDALTTPTPMDIRSDSAIQRDEDLILAMPEEQQPKTIIPLLKVDIKSETIENEDDIISAMPQKKKTRYPEYVIKAIFYEADDQHVEVLLDQAINFIANDPRFQYLWHDEQFIKELYSDKTYSQAVERLIREIKDIEFTEKADFFHQFVYREYSRERKDYLRDCMDAEQQHKHEQMATDEYSRSNSSSSSLQTVFTERDRTQSVSKHNIANKYTLVYKGKDRKDVDMVFKIRHYKKEDITKYNSNKPDYFQLPSIAPKSNFMWAQYYQKRIKRSNKPMRAHGYWKLLKAEDFDSYEQQISIEASNSIRSAFSLTKRFNKIRENSPPPPITDTQLTQLSVGTTTTEGNMRKKVQKRTQIPLSHLNRILGLLRFYVKQKKLEKNRTWLYEKGGLPQAFTFKDHQTDNRLRGKKDVVVIIQNELNERIEYNIAWWNGGDALDSNVGLAIRKKSDPSKFFYFQCFKVDDKKIEWQWYNNDESYFQKFDLGFDAFAQLEASFQANLHSMFPWNIMDETRKSESPFNEPFCPEMVKGMKEKGVQSIAKYYVIRYLFTKSKRIQDMEQLSINKNQPEYPRRIKRMIAGTNQNTLFAYFLTSSDFTDEWKRRFLLTEESQVYYFWAFILSIATTMKYMELEMENQFITFSFRRSKNASDGATFSGLDTSDLRREMRNMDLFDGFIVPPMQIMQTQDVQNNEDQMKPTQWYRTLSTVGILKRMKYYHVYDGTLHYKPNHERKKNQNERYETCPHEFANTEYPWQGKSVCQCINPLRPIECHKTKRCVGHLLLRSMRKHDAIWRIFEEILLRV